MRRSEKPPSRPGSSRSDQLPVYLSLVSTKADFLDTLFINRATEVPLYATVTEAECTTLYAIDRNMELHRVINVNWDQGGKYSRTTLTNRANETVPLSEVATNNQTVIGAILDKKQTTDINYSYGRFISRWAEKHRENNGWFDDMNYSNIVCHQKQPVSNSIPETSTTPSTPTESERPFATMTLCDAPWPGNSRIPRIKIDLHTREALQRITHEDGFTDIDHVILGALLTCTRGGRKRGREPDGWLNATQLQEHLRAKRQLQRTRSTQTLPLYRPRPSMEGLPPAYASRISLQSRQSTR